MTRREHLALAMTQRTAVLCPHCGRDFGLALAAIARVLDEGARTHSGDWRDESASFHTGRAERHLRLLRETDTAEDHLANAACRLLMALELRERAAEARKPSDIPMPNPNSK
jgi:hypothetical protein